MSSTQQTNGAEDGWTVVNHKKVSKVAKPVGIPVKKYFEFAETIHNRMIGFRPIPEWELRNLPREIQIAHADDKLAREKRYKKEMEDRYTEWCIHEEKRSIKAWIKECLSIGACLNCGESTHHANECQKLNTVPVWLENDVLVWQFPLMITES